MLLLFAYAEVDIDPPEPPGPAPGAVGSYGAAPGRRTVPRVYWRTIRPDDASLGPPDAPQEDLPADADPLPIYWPEEFIPPKVDSIHLAQIRAAMAEADDEAALLALL